MPKCHSCGVPVENKTYRTVTMSHIPSVGIIVCPRHYEEICGILRLDTRRLREVTA